MLIQIKYVNIIIFTKKLNNLYSLQNYLAIQFV